MVFGWSKGLTARPEANRIVFEYVFASLNAKACVWAVNDRMNRRTLSHAQPLGIYVK